MEGPLEGALAVVDHRQRQVEGAVEEVVREAGVGDHIREVGLWPGVEPDLALDAGEAPEVLALQEAAVAPPVDLERQRVVAGPDGVGDVELGGQLGSLAVSDTLPIDPQEEGRLDRPEVEYDAVTGPVPGQGEVPAVAADRVPAVRYVRWGRGLLPIEGVGVIGVDGRAEAFELPVGRHRDVVPTGDVEGRILEADGPLLRRSGPVEFPDAVQRAVAAGQVRALDGGAGRLGGGVEGGAGGQLVFLDHGRILDVGEEGLGRSEDREQEATEEDREAETGHGGPDSGMRAA